MKRIRLFTLLSVLAVALSVGLLPGIAEANGGSGSPNQVTIQPQASLIFTDATIDVGLYVKCQGGSGLGEVIVNVKQSPPATPSPVAAGSGPQTVVCDGQTHSVGVTVSGFGFDAGTATATADLMMDSPTVVAHVQRSIKIVVVTG